MKPTEPTVSPRLVAIFLFASGLCAVAYQTAWLRELRLVFGASTAATAAVLAIFMAGLGAGGVVLGRRADRSPNPLALYARLEIAVALLAAASPVLIAAARGAYVWLGGTSTMGGVAATVLRLLLSALVLGPATFLMGATLPAATRAAASQHDLGRRVLGKLYGANTLGAVSGALLVTFVTVEHLGIRKSILLAAATNLLLGLWAYAVARARRATGSTTEPVAVPEDADGESGSPTFVLGAAAVVGFVFFLMELVWYRMLSPILGGSSYTFGLILAVALAGIGAGGLLYGVAGGRRPTLAGFAMTCALEACAIALPFALGDRLAFAALVLRGLGGGGFLALAAGWGAIAGLVVLPAALVAGYQFPLLVGVLGSGRRALGHEVGLAYGWNTAGAIVGSLAGGFGLLPLLGATLAWRAGAVILVLLALAAALAGPRRRERALLRPGLVALSALLLLAADGPTGAWRHGRIGAGRFAGDWSSPNALRASFENARSSIVWEQDGVESSVALWDDDGYAFFINGKSDGNARGDAPTQVMGGLVGAMLHPEPRTALVIGLGSGSTAGWLAHVDGMERVDVAEIEPAIRRIAEVSEPVNRACLRNPRVAMHWGDARELLLTTRQRYDIIFSEPSNPYRAGISSLFTLEYYRAAARRLQPRGLYLQWIQGYEVDAEVVRTAIATLNAVFPVVEVWQLHSSDLLLVAAMEELDHDLPRERERAAREPFASAMSHVWGVAGVEGFYSAWVAPPEFARRMRAAAGDRLNTDDRPRIEFGFIRNLGRAGLFGVEDLRAAAGEGRPRTRGGELDWQRVEDMRRARALLLLEVPAAASDPSSPAGWRAQARIAFATRQPAAALALWTRQEELPASRADLLMLASGLASQGADPAPKVLAELAGMQATEARALEARWLAQRGERGAALEVLEDALRRYRDDPWPHAPTMNDALELALHLSADNPAAGRRMFAALAEPFSVHMLNHRRLTIRVGIADLLADRELCREALAPLEEKPRWERVLLEARVRCYGGQGGPLARRAARDLEDYLAAEPRPLF